MLTPNNVPHGAIRQIRNVEVNTPLLAPSFSSAGFPNIGDVYHAVKHHLYGVCLVSALDIASGRIPQNIAEEINLVILDSGTYESNQNSSSDEAQSSYANCNWSRDWYQQIASRCDPASNQILVNYDVPGPLKDQIRWAQEDFSCAPHAAKDLLVKPETLNSQINIARLITYTQTMHKFDMIGLTARESGTSLLRRCRAIVTLRNALRGAGLEIPIHVFGAITPAEVLTYFFCGADVFDGLNWLRLSFRYDIPVPVEQLAFREYSAGVADNELRMTEWVANLNLLYRLQEALHLYTTSRDLECLFRQFPSTLQARRIAEIAGAEV